MALESVAPYSLFSSRLNVYVDAMKTLKSFSNPESPFQPSWKFFEGLIVVGAIAVGLLIWFVPNWAESDTMKEITAAVEHRRAVREQAEAVHREIEEERERLGLVYFGPGGVPIIDENGESAPPTELPPTTE